MERTNANIRNEEIILRGGSGMLVLIVNTLAIVACIAAFTMGIIRMERQSDPGLAIALIIVGALYGFVIGPILYAGLKVLQPSEARVLTLFGRYHGTLKGEGFYFVNPFVESVNPAADNRSAAVASGEQTTATAMKMAMSTSGGSGSGKKISLKVMTLSNDMQKINDQLGTPIIIGIVVVWKVVNTAKAVFNVDNYKDYLSTQCDSALRNIVRLYPYDSAGTDYEKSLRGSSQEVADRLKEEIQAKVDIAGLEILEARITNLSYAQEIAAAMLQRQQASAIVDARQMIVEGAVGMVEMALDKLNESGVVQLDEERKAAMVSNLLVVLCGNRDAQPVVNSGTIY